MRRHVPAKLPMLLVFPAVVGTLALFAGCNRQAPPPTTAHSDPALRPPPSEVSPDSQPSTPGETLALADRMYEGRLGATRGQFDDDRQIAVLQQEVLLYRQFLERADGQPELEPAVRKSRERIADAEATIEFLKKHQRGDDTEPPAAPGE
jgi:hypothetical protein